MKIAIFGAGGMIGQRVTLEALVRGHEVKALLRHPEDFPIAHPRLTVAQVNILEAASVAEAVTGYDAVVNATSAHKNDMDALTFYMHSTHAVIEGVKRAGVPRLLVVGGAGSLEVAPGVQLVDTPEFPSAWHAGASALRDALPIYRNTADVNWTFFCPSAMIAPGKRTGSYQTGTNQLLTNEQGESYISAEDYAVALLDEIEKPQFERQRFTATSLKA